jgi:preprotein translocase subunit SecG
MSTLVTIIHVAVSLFLMVTVLLQSGKGGGMGAAFGAGGSGTVFGGSGAGNFLRRLTVVCAALFMLTSAGLAYIASSTGSDSLRRYSEQQRQYSQTMQEAREAALATGAEDTAEQPATGEGAEDTTEQPATDEGAELEAGDTAAPEGAALGDTAPATGDTATGDTAPAAGGTVDQADGTEPAAAPDAPAATPNP